MKSKQKTVVVDADAIVAQANIKDINHLKATKISENLNSQGVKVLYPVTAIAEATTVIQAKMNSLATAIGTAQVFTNPDYKVISIDQEIYSYAINSHFSNVSNKRDTLFDCIIIAVADKYEADAIFSFDNFYRKKGYKLASDL